MPVRVAVVDVGSNTLRLLVAKASSGGRLATLTEERSQLGLGEEIEIRGCISRRKLRAVTKTARFQLTRARKLDCHRVHVLITSPGRQSANAHELLAALHEAGAPTVRVLSAEEEAHLAWVGAVSGATDLPDAIAVCDVGGGSTQIAVGTRAGGPNWARSYDVGSLRLTRRLLCDDPPPAAAIAAARVEASRHLSTVVAPAPSVALATGGTARALRRVVGPSLDQLALETAVLTLAGRTRRAIAKEYRLDPHRARTLLAGTLLLTEAQRRLGVPLRVASGGVREGAAVALLRTFEAAGSAKL